MNNATTPFTSEAAAQWRQDARTYVGRELNAWYLGQTRLKVKDADHLLKVTADELEDARRMAAGKMGEPENYYCAVASHALRASVVARFSSGRTTGARAAALRELEAAADALELAARTRAGLA